MKRILNATDLKLLAIVAMTCDHFAFAFLSSESVFYFLMRMFGRITAPIMAFFIAEGFIYTKDRKRYFMRLLVFAIISQPFYFVLLFSRFPNSFLEYVSNLNIMFTLCSSLLILIIIENQKLLIWAKLFFIGACCAFSDIYDWSYIVPAWTLTFYIFRNEQNKINIVFVIVSILLPMKKYLSQYGGFAKYCFFFGVLLALVPISLYNGGKGKVGGRIFNKCFFYVYFPLHILFIIVCRVILFG